MLYIIGSMEEINLLNHNIMKGETKILTPLQFQRFVSSIPKKKYRTMFEALFYSGMRYREFMRLYKHPETFDGFSIHVKKFKPKQRIKDRYVHLNHLGRMAVNNFLMSGLKPPHPINWVSDVQRWAGYAGFNPKEFGAKTTRKTWESWLIATKPHMIVKIVMSQGHSESVSLLHYANIPFYPEEIRAMFTYVADWGETSGQRLMVPSPGQSHHESNHPFHNW